MELPKLHFSHSQMILAEKNMKQYYKRYVLGQKTFETKYLKKGKEFAEAMEEDESENEIIASMLPFIKKLDIAELEVSAVFENDIFPGLILLGKKDTCTPGVETGEYKTGSVAWDQDRVKMDGQLVFYAVIDELNGQEKPNKAWLQWFEAKKTEDGQVEFTGHTEEFERKITKADITHMKKRILKVLKMIKEYEYKETLEIDNKIIARYAKLDRLEKLIADEKAAIKESVKNMVEIANCQEAEAEAGKFYLKNNPPKWTYTLNTQKKETALKQAQLKEQQSGAATKTVTQSLTWQAVK